MKEKLPIKGGTGARSKGSFSQNSTWKKAGGRQEVSFQQDLLKERTAGGDNQLVPRHKCDLEAIERQNFE